MQEQRGSVLPPAQVECGKSLQALWKNTKSTGNEGAGMNELERRKLSFKEEWENALEELNHIDGLQRILAAIWLLRDVVSTAQFEKHFLETVARESLSH